MHETRIYHRAKIPQQVEVIYSQQKEAMEKVPELLNRGNPLKRVSKVSCEKSSPTCHSERASFFFQSMQEQSKGPGLVI
jgi:hypothetical protein